MKEVELSEEEQLCLYCKKSKPLTAFSQKKGKTAQCRKICLECEQFRQDERHGRVAVQRERGPQQQQEREERRRQSWQRSMALRQREEKRSRERESWYLQQPDQCCRACHQVLPASDFEGHSSSNGFVLYVHCKRCHETQLERRLLACCLCQKRTPRRNFLSTFKEYVLCSNGIAFSLCCKDCERAFLALSEVRQALAIRACCQRTFPSGQVIYAEVDPLTGERRYVGRTGKPERRHAQHLCDRSSAEGLWGAQKTVWYTRRNWMQALIEQGVKPSMEILYPVRTAPLVLEWEQRFICHGIQQGWKLLNWEMMDEALVARARATHLDFLRAPFEVLVQHHFFATNGLVAFLHRWSQPDSFQSDEPLLKPYMPLFALTQTTT